MLTCPKCRGERAIMPEAVEPVQDEAPGKLAKIHESKAVEARPCDECSGKGIIRDPQLDEMMQHYQAVVVGLSNLTQWLNTLMGFFARQHGWSLEQDATGRATMRPGVGARPARTARPH